jgi:adenylate kinase
MLTGTPGVGKTTIAKALGEKLGLKAVNEKQFAIEEKIGKWDAEENELVIPLEEFGKAMARFLKKEKNVIIEGHLLCELKLPVDVVLLLRTHPEILEARLEARGYSQEKVQENVFCEGIDYCKKQLRKRYGKEDVAEIGVEKTIKETIDNILGELKKRGCYE